MAARADPAPAVGLFDAPMLNGRPDWSEVMALKRQFPKTAAAVEPFFIAGKSQTNELMNRCCRVRSEFPREKKKLNGLFTPRLPPKPLREL